MLIRTRRPGRRDERDVERDERGAAAVVCLLVALVAFTFAALTVDLGNALARRGDTQVQADFGALAGAPFLTGENTRSVSDPAVQKVAEYMFANLPADDAPGYTPPASVAAVANALVDADTTNGDITFPADGRMVVTGPETEVDFGFAGIFGVFDGPDAGSGVVVRSNATVATGTPDGYGVWPMYVANPSPGNPACDYGLQTLTDPPGGQVVPPAVPTLYADGDTNDTTLDSVALTVDGLPATTVPINSATAQVTLEGRFRDTTRIGFFKSNDSTAAPSYVVRATTDWVAPASTPTTGYTSNNGAVTVKVPAGVAGEAVLWYVRAYQNGVNRWSARSGAQPLSVGDAPYECVGSSSSGNFGTIKLPRGDSSNTQNDAGWIPRNIARGLQAPLTLDKWPSTPAPTLCTTATAERVFSSSGSDRRAKTNCVDTDTGVTANTATPGFITGKASAYTGLLDTDTSEDPDGSGGCSSDGDTDRRDLPGTSVDVNDDLLTCFFDDDHTTTSIDDVARRNYAGDAVFDPAIYSSPRFGWVPVFGEEATSGGSQKYTIVDFRGAFIADQPLTATKANPLTNSTTYNGLGVTGSGGGFKLQTLKVIFLHPDSLPDGEAATPLGPNLGVGPIVTRLVD